MSELLGRDNLEDLIGSTLPEFGFIRLKQIIGDAKAEPPIQPLIPISNSSWWEGVKAGIYPPAVKLSKRSSAWRVRDIRLLIKLLDSGKLEGHKW